MTQHIKSLMDELQKLEKAWNFLPHILHHKVVKKRLQIEQEMVKEKLASIDNLDLLLEYPYFKQVIDYLKQNGFIGKLEVFKKTSDYEHNYNYECQQIMIRHAEIDISKYAFEEYLELVISYGHIKELLAEPPYDLTNKNMVELLSEIEDVKTLLGFQPDSFNEKINNLLHKIMSQPEINHRKIVTYEEMVKNKQRALENELTMANTHRRSNYFNHCWNCHQKIDGRVNQVCPKCKTYFICPHCGKCKCGYDINKAKKDTYMPF